MAQMTEVFRQLLQERGNNPQGVEPRTVLPSEFTKFNPPIFAGLPDPDVAEVWLERMKDIFKMLNCVDSQRVTFATFQLEGMARDWWAILERKWQGAGTAGSWDEFCREFRKKFVPSVVAAQRAKEFLALRQGNRTVAEYEAE